MPEVTAPPPSAARDTLATFLISAAMLGMQISWTRILSFAIWYHFAFLVLSAALLGFTVGGLWLNLRPERIERDPQRLLFWSALAFSVCSGLTLLVICNLPLAGGVLDSPRSALLFTLLVLLLAASFLPAGVFIAGVLARRSESVSRIYGANLLGSGAGCALAVPLLDHMPAAAAVLAFALLAWLALLPLVPHAGSRARIWAVCALTGAALLAGLVRAQHPLEAPFYLQSAKPFPKLSKERIIARLSSSLATVDLFGAEELTGLWGLSDEHYLTLTNERPLPDRLGICIDGWALTFLYRSPFEITEEPVFDFLPATIAYELASPKSALVLGAGGGIDIVVALRRGVRAITAVEINPSIVEIGRGLANFNGDILARPGVETIVAEGRSFVRSAGSRRWDLVQLSGVDTLAASQAGAFTLAESYLYTREAFEAYLRHLEPGGILTLTRWMSDLARQTLRVITLASAALRAIGIREPRDHILLITDVRRAFSVFAISTTPFSEQQSQRALAATRARGFIPLAIPHVQLGAEPNVFERLIHTPDQDAFIEDYPFDISVTTDDKPFFFEHTRWKNAWTYPDRILDRYNGHLILLATALLVALLGVAFILVPARYGLPAAARGRAHQRRLAYFACLGLGYVLVEMVLIQKLTLYLGHPVYALTVVLCGMLTFSGVGALASGVLSRGRVARAALLVAVCLVAYRLGLDAFVQSTLGLPLAARVALALAVIALPATLMGAPFPTAARHMAALEHTALTRGWVVNGYCSVLGSCLTMIVSISFGFGTVLASAAAIYACAALVWPRS
ncbi:MAG TPA: hypothetical protein VJR89_05920 [Polyangiales bacterium]|nr:hypothetical protein [Polyangiales bacterium]